MKKIRLEGHAIEDTDIASEKILIDTNLLVFAHHEGSQYHQQASYILLACLQGSLRAYVSSQNLLEFYSVMTSPRKIKPTPDIGKVSRICSDLLSSRHIGKIYPSETVVVETIEVSRKAKIHGPNIFDCFLAITAKQNQINRIWTDNVSDLASLQDFVIVEDPLKMIWELDEEKA